MKIAVLMGGPGSERDVSLATGRGVAKALRSLGADVTEVDVRDENFKLPDDIELAFICLHGTFGEDGQIQQILEDRGVAYTGEDVEGSRLAFDKIRSKEKFREAGITTPNWQVIRGGPEANDSNSDRHQGAAPGLDRRRLHCKNGSRDRIRFAGRREVRSGISRREIYAGARADHRNSR